ncbi:MAG: hypothetical protein ACI8RZ_002649 [Myxococcota bacterium]|jgi:hypothetical protein
MSRSTTHPWPLPADTPRSCRTPGLWHVSCILFRVTAAATIFSLANGCFYWRPFEEIPVNEPPTIDAVSSTIGEPIVLDQSSVKVFVIVKDLDDVEALSFRWSITSFGLQENWSLIPDAGASAVASQLELFYNDAYDGKTLTFYAEDAAGDSVRAEWPIQVGGEAQ